MLVAFKQKSTTQRNAQQISNVSMTPRKVYPRNLYIINANDFFTLYNTQGTQSICIWRAYCSINILANFETVNFIVTVLIVVIICEFLFTAFIIFFYCYYLCSLQNLLWSCLKTLSNHGWSFADLFDNLLTARSDKLDISIYSLKVNLSEISRCFFPTTGLILNNLNFVRKFILRLDNSPWP